MYLHLVQGVSQKSYLHFLVTFFLFLCLFSNFCAGNVLKKSQAMVIAENCWGNRDMIFGTCCINFLLI